MTSEFHIEFHEKNDIARITNIIFSSEIQCGIHESGIEFFLNPISHFKILFCVLFMPWNNKSAGYLFNIEFHAKFISSIANQSAAFEIDMGFTLVKSRVSHPQTNRHTYKQKTYIHTNTQANKNKQKFKHLSWTVEWMDGWMDGCMDGWMLEWVNGWMNALVIKRINDKSNSTINKIVKKIKTILWFSLKNK